MSVRGERVVYRERETDWEPEPRRSYTTVKRYQVPDRAPTAFDGDETKEKIIIKRERREEAPTPARSEVGGGFRVTERVTERDREYPRRDREEVDYRYTERITEREREPEPQRRDISYRVIERESDSGRYAPARSEFRVVERDREVIRAPSPPAPERVREYRFEREREFSPPRREERPYELEKYSKSTEYFAQPQPIVIRESAPQPIIIREERREPQQIIIRREEPHYEFIEREEVREDRQLIRREEPEPPAPPPAASVVSRSVVKSVKQQPEEENYFYERRVREVERAPRRHEDDIRPRDSASQYGSDDSYEYVRRERYVEEEGGRSRSRSRSPHHRRHLAEGALAGLAGAEIIRHHRKNTTGESGHRGRQLIGGAALGAVGAEVLSRTKSLRRGSRDRSRSRSSSYESTRRRRKHKSRSRSRSKSRARQIGGIAAVAAVGALAGYVLKNSGKNKETVIINDGARRRSRSRRRGASVDTGYIGDGPLDDRSRDPSNRNRRIAQAGLATAAAAGIFDRVRSKSRGAKGKGGKSREQSRIRTGIPIAAAGLGGAALAGLYEKNKASKQATRDAIIQDELDRGRGRGSRSRSRSRSVPAPYPASDGRGVDDRGLIAYGAEPIYPEGADAGRGYYSDEEPGMYRRRHRRGSSSGSSPDTRRRSRSRGRNFTEAAAAAGVAGVAAHELGKRSERKKAERERRRREDGYDEPYHDEFDDRTPSGYITPPAHEPAAYNQQHQTYPGGNYFPPPPTGTAAYEANVAAADPYAHHQAQQSYDPYPPYNPADYPPAGAAAAGQPYGETRGMYGDSEANLGAPHPNETYAGDSRYAGAPLSAEEAAARERDEATRGRDPGNVSGSADILNDSTIPGATHSVGGGVGDDGREGRSVRAMEGGAAQDADGVRTPRARSTSRVRFDLGSNTAHSPEDSRYRSRSRSRNRDHDRDSVDPDANANNTRQQSDSEASASGTRRRSRRKRRGSRDRHRSSQAPVDDGHHRGAPEGYDSDDTVELPERFDETGNRRPEAEGGDELSRVLQKVFDGGSGGAGGGGGLGDLLGGLFGGGAAGGGGGEDSDGRSGRRRRRG